MSQIVRGEEVRGVGFPMEPGREGLWSRRNSRALRRSSIKMILGTRIGERVGEPTFGSQLYELAFAPADLQTLSLARRYTIDALAQDPLIGVISVAAEFTNDATLAIFIDYVDRGSPQPAARREAFTIRRA